MFMRFAIALHLVRFDNSSVGKTYYSLAHNKIRIASKALATAGRPQCYLLSTATEVLRNDDDAVFARSMDSLKGKVLSGAIVDMPMSHIPSNMTIHQSTFKPMEGILQRLHDAMLETRNDNNTLLGSPNVRLQIWNDAALDFLDTNFAQTRYAHQGLRTLQLTLDIPDCFMDRLKARGSWSFFDPQYVPLLLDAHSVTFTDRYTFYESDVTPTMTRPALDVWHSIMKAMFQTGGPTIVFSDVHKIKSNFNYFNGRLTNPPSIYSQYDPNPCALGSLVLTEYAMTAGAFNYNALRATTADLVGILTRFFDVHHYSSPEDATRSMSNRMIGIGVSGLAETLIKLNMPFDSYRAVAVSRQISEVIYFAALEASAAMTKTGHPVSAAYWASPLSTGVAQFHLHDDQPRLFSVDDWQRLLNSFTYTGVANGTLTLQLSNFPSPPMTLMTDGLPHRTVQIPHPLLVAALEEASLWSEEIRSKIISNSGSLQLIQSLPSSIKQRFRTAFDLPPTAVIHHAVARAPYLTLYQELVLYGRNPLPRDLDSLVLHVKEKDIKVAITGFNKLITAHHVVDGVNLDINTAT
ncbi:hypothetical protein CVT26_009859 [Gymnopilus dilepis]|uniref:Ribonucleotide reductase large subunit C-terminal domain-containing protein n=1 Tax=Gymnopilus dilepis TaxID=231916 RepID=A0A409YC51_9AGAR|nr:hypothetical protein CVT26_009859 [Gymnopilus dilepis]